MGRLWYLSIAQRVFLCLDRMHFQLSWHELPGLCDYELSVPFSCTAIRQAAPRESAIRDPCADIAALCTTDVAELNCPKGMMMIKNIYPGKVLVVAIASIFFSGCANAPREPNQVQEPDQIQAAPTRSEKLANPEANGSVLDEASVAQYRNIFKRFKTLETPLLQMEESNADVKLARTIALLRKKENVVNDTVGLYAALTEASRKNFYAFSEARWRTVHLMGELRLNEAKEPLFNIASGQLPNPKEVSDSVFASEFRIRARAIAGLEKLKAIDSLQKIYEQKGLMSGVAAASLYELGQPPKGIRRLDAKQAFGEIDPADFKPKRKVIDARRMKLPDIPAAEQAQRIVPESNK